MKKRIYFNDRVNSIDTGRKPSPELYIPQERELKKLNIQSDLTLMHQINTNLRNAKGIQISIAGARAILDKETDSIIVICEDIYDRDNVLQYLKTIYEETLNIVKDKEDGFQLILTRKPNSDSSQLLDESLYDLRKDPNLFDKIYEVASQVREEMESKYGGDFLYGKCIEASDKIVSLLKDKNVNAHTVEGWVTYDYDECCSDRNYDEHTWVETEEDYIVDVTATQFNHFMEDDYPPIIITKKLPYGFSLQRPNNNNINEDFSDKYDFARHYQKHVSQQAFDMDYKNNQMDFISPKIYEDRAIELMNSKAGLSNSNEDEVIGFMVSEDRALKYNRRYNTIVIYNINTNDIVTYYKTNYKKYLFKLERDYKGELPENKDEIINNEWATIEEESLTEAKKSKKKRKSQTQNNPVFKDINDIMKWVKKRQKGLSPFSYLNPNAGNVEYNNDMFNHLTGADGGDFGSISGSGNELGAPAIGSDMGSFGGDASVGGGMGESFKMEEKVKNNSTQEEMSPNVKLFIEENIDLIEDEDWDELFELAQNDPKYYLHLNDEEIDELIHILVNVLGADFEIIE